MEKEMCRRTLDNAIAMEIDAKNEDGSMSATRCWVTGLLAGFGRAVGEDIKDVHGRLQKFETKTEIAQARMEGKIDMIIEGMKTLSANKNGTPQSNGLTPAERMQVMGEIALSIIKNKWVWISIAGIALLSLYGLDGVKLIIGAL